MTLNGARQARTGAAGVVAGAAAVAVGAFGWLIAHSLNFWLVAHSHHGALSTSTNHVSEVTATAAVVAGGLAGAALITFVLAATRDSAGHAPSPRRSRHVVQVAAGLSTVAFLAADALEHAILGVQSTSPAMFLTGLVLHAAFGAATSLYWLRFTDGVRSLILPALMPVEVPASRAPQRRRRTPWWRRYLLAHTIAGRAPPLG